MNITVNGNQREMDSPASVAGLIAELGIRREGIAVAVNREIVVRSAWQTHLFEDGDVIEIITAAQGG